MDTIPGVHRRTAEVLIAEIGTNLEISFPLIVISPPGPNCSGSEVRVRLAATCSAPPPRKSVKICSTLINGTPRAYLAKVRAALTLAGGAKEPSRRGVRRELGCGRAAQTFVGRNPGACPDATQEIRLGRGSRPSPYRTRASNKLITPASNRSRSGVRIKLATIRSAPPLPKPGSTCNAFISGSPPLGRRGRVELNRAVGARGPNR